MKFQVLSLIKLILSEGHEADHQEIFMNNSNCQSLR